MRIGRSLGQIEVGERRQSSPERRQRGSETRRKEVVPVQIHGMSVYGGNKRFVMKARTEGITMSKKHSRGLQGGLLAAFFLAAIGLIAGNAFAGGFGDFFGHHYGHYKKDHNKTPKCESAKNMKIIGYNDDQSRETLQVSVLRQGKRQFAFLGEHDRGSWQPLHFNDLTGQYEENGTSIMDISDPAHPTLVAHIPNFTYDGSAQENRNSRSASVVYNLMGSDRDFLVRNSEGNGTSYYEVFEITNITRDGGVTYVKLGNIQSTDSCGSGCGGTLTSVHKGYFSPSGFYYGVESEPGFNSRNHWAVWDLRDLPSVNPGAWNQELGRFVGRGWIEGQKSDEPDLGNPGMHHPIVDEENSRVYGAYNSGGNAVSWNIDFRDGEPHPDPASGDLKRFPIAWQLDTSPPYRGIHTLAPFYYDEVPNYTGNALPRVYALTNNEAGGDDIVPCPGGIRAQAFMMDITSADNFSTPPGTGTAFNVDTWQIPVQSDGVDYCAKGGRFGPHQYNETQNGKINRAPDKIVYFAYFNAGVRVLDISDPYNMKEVGHCVYPDNDQNTGVTLEQDQLGYKVIQANDVDTDDRGLVYVTDRVGTGFYVMQYFPEKKKDH
jgi:hypothetical protein